ncbi:MAG: TIGR03032 family protein [Thiolinea sp.]
MQILSKTHGFIFQQRIITFGTLSHIYRLENILGFGQILDNIYSHCYVPRVSYFTGFIDIHDILLSLNGDPIFAATRYNCIATISSIHSFKPIWKPSFISQIVAEDRCHLNGVTSYKGLPIYATAFSITDYCEGWRDCLHSGGIIFDLQNNNIICEDLFLPHSPRMIGQNLWVLNSGRGELGFIEKTTQNKGTFQPVAQLPGLTRGLNFHEDFAIIGLSRPRYDKLEDNKFDCFTSSSKENWCGFQIIDIKNGDCMHWFRIEGKVREIYDIVVMANVDCAQTISPHEDGIDLITVDMSHLLV